MIGILRKINKNLGILQIKKGIRRISYSDLKSLLYCTSRSKQYDYRISGTLENSSTIMKNAFFIPNHQDIKEEQRKYMADCITGFIEDKKWQKMVS